MEVKIGVQQTAREVVLQSEQSSESVLALVAAALKDGVPLMLTDDKGRTVVVPGDKIAYVEVGASVVGKIGFGAS